MKKEILIDREKGLTRVAILEDEELCEFYLEREGAEKLAGNIYKGRVQNVLRGMQAAFVDIGTGKNAFLYLGDEGPDKRDLAFPGQEAQIPAARQERVVANQDAMSSSRRRWTASASPAASRRRGSASASRPRPSA